MIPARRPWLPILFALAAPAGLLAAPAPADLPAGDKPGTVHRTHSADRPVYAHLCTWFKTKEFSGRWEMWGSDYADALHDPDRRLEDGRHDIAATAYPLTDVYDTSDPALIEYHFLLMRLAGIDGIVVDWDGRRLNAYRHEGLMAVLPYLERYHLKLILCFEEWCGYWPKGTYPDRRAEINAAREEIRYLMDTFVNTPIYGTVGGKKPVIIFRKIPDQWFSADEWEQQLAPLITDNGGVLLIDTDPASRLAQVSDGTYFWIGGFSKNVSTLQHCEKVYRDFLAAPGTSLRTQPPFRFGSAHPAFNDTPVWGWGDGPRIAPDYEGRRFQLTWELSISNAVDLVQLVTWNDWNEGSAIEPADTYGYRYLELNKKYSAQYKGIADTVPNEALRLPLKLYRARQNTGKIADPAQQAAVAAKLDQVRDALLAGQYQKAARLADQKLP
jgi:glycoprotein endo-alpha-1,2-mannosidase